MNIRFKLGIYLFKLQVRKGNGYKGLLKQHPPIPTFKKENMIYYEINDIH